MEIFLKAGSIDEHGDIVFKNNNLDITDVSNLDFTKSKLIYQERGEIKFEIYKKFFTEVYYIITLITEKRDKWNRKIPIVMIIKLEKSEKVGNLSTEIIKKIKEFSTEINYPISTEIISKLETALKKTSHSEVNIIEKFKYYIGIIAKTIKAIFNSILNVFNR